MTDVVKHRGAKPLSDRDWLFGSRPRRRLLDGVLLHSKRGAAWTRAELAAHAGVVANGGVDEHVAGLARLGLIVAVDERRWALVHPRPELGKAVRQVLLTLADAADRPAPRTRARATGIGVARSAVRAAERAVTAAQDELGPVVTAEILALLSEARERAVSPSATRSARP